MKNLIIYCVFNPKYEAGNNFHLFLARIQTSRIARVKAPYLSSMIRFSIFWKDSLTLSGCNAKLLEVDLLFFLWDNMLYLILYSTAAQHLEMPKSVYNYQLGRWSFA